VLVRYWVPYPRTTSNKTSTSAVLGTLLSTAGKTLIQRWSDSYPDGRVYEYIVGVGPFSTLPIAATGPVVARQVCRIYSQG
jgi:hypothetical protein